MLFIPSLFYIYTSEMKMSIVTVICKCKKSLMMLIKHYFVMFEHTSAHRLKHLAILFVARCKWVQLTCRNFQIPQAPTQTSPETHSAEISKQLMVCSLAVLIVIHTELSVMSTSVTSCVMENNCNELPYPRHCDDSLVFPSGDYAFQTLNRLTLFNGTASEI